jgi:hypothetical protein
MIRFARVIRGTDRNGNAMVISPNESRGIVLLDSLQLKFGPGTCIEYADEYLEKRLRVDCIWSYSSTDFAFWDRKTQDLLIIRRTSFKEDLSPNCFYRRTSGFFTSHGVIEETSPRVKYYVAPRFNLHACKDKEDLLSLLSIPNVELIEGTFLDRDEKSFLSVPQRPNPARATLERYLQTKLNWILKQTKKK